MSTAGVTCRSQSETGASASGKGREQSGPHCRLQEPREAALGAVSERSSSSGLRPGYPGRKREPLKAGVEDRSREREAAGC